MPSSSANVIAAAQLDFGPSPRSGVIPLVTSQRAPLISWRHSISPDFKCENAEFTLLYCTVLSSFTTRYSPTGFSEVIIVNLTPLLMAGCVISSADLSVGSEVTHFTEFPRLAKAQATLYSAPPGVI